MNAERRAGYNDDDELLRIISPVGVGEVPGGGVTVGRPDVGVAAAVPGTVLFAKARRRRGDW
jgi:hypothetical protein